MKTKTLIIQLCFCFSLLIFFPSFGFSDDTNYEIVFWETIKDSKEPVLYQSYLEKYPDGTFAEIAKILKKKYTKNTTPQQQPEKKPPVVIQQKNKKTKNQVAKKLHNNLAVFPIKFLDDAEDMQKIVLDDLTRVLARHSCVKPSHSYYKLDDKYPVTNIRNSTVISSGSLHQRNLWHGSTPNSSTISSLGKKIGADVVATASIRVTNPWSDSYRLGYIRIFLIDVATGKIIRTSNKSNLGDARNILPSVIQEAVDLYTKQFCK